MTSSYIFLLPWSAVLHRIDFFHLEGLRGSGLKEHIFPQNKQFILRLQGSSVDHFRLVTGSPTLVHFWVGEIRFTYFAMWYEDI